MSKKILTIILIFISFAILGGAGYYIFIDKSFINGWLDKSGDAAPTGQAAKDTKPAEQTGQVANTEIKKINIGDLSQTPPEENTASAEAVQPTTKDDLMRLAASFAERFGSYSNQSNYSNISDLKIFMTQKMSDWADNFIKQERQKEISSIYYGITTKAISREMKELDEDEGKASVLVGVRRREATSTTNNVSNFFNQNIIINLVRENGIWKVDSANWQM